ncbi:hypothetical protein PR048_007603 [Dryococelus australis]|uniref:Uncharacterized protein n=1 Tax=Dryococelus australis TaxID=614101 RepID=A0ABQ9HUT4_9NEOP|nr:hypothetical protein PR048_007603 [Dryococelus australis]
MSFLHWLLHDCEFTPVLTELHAIGPHTTVKCPFIRTVAQGVPDKVWSNDKRISKIHMSEVQRTGQVLTCNAEHIGQQLYLVKQPILYQRAKMRAHVFHSVTRSRGQTAMSRQGGYLWHPNDCAAQYLCRRVSHETPCHDSTLAHATATRTHGLDFGAMATSLSVLRASFNYEEQGKNRQERLKNPCDREAHTPLRRDWHPYSYAGRLTARTAISTAVTESKGPPASSRVRQKSRQAWLTSGRERVPTLYNSIPHTSAVDSPQNPVERRFANFACFSTSGSSAFIVGLPGADVLLPSSTEPPRLDKDNTTGNSARRNMGTDNDRNHVLERESECPLHRTLQAKSETLYSSSHAAISSAKSTSRATVDLSCRCRPRRQTAVRASLLGESCMLTSVLANDRCGVDELQPIIFLGRLVLTTPANVVSMLYTVLAINEAASSKVPLSPVRLLASHLGEPGSIPGRFAPDFRKWGSYRTMPLAVSDLVKDGAALECKGGGNRSYPEKTRRQAASSSTIPTCESPGVNPPGMEPGSPRAKQSPWRVAVIVTQPWITDVYLPRGDTRDHTFASHSRTQEAAPVDFSRLLGRISPIGRSRLASDVVNVDRHVGTFVRGRSRSADHSTADQLLWAWRNTASPLCIPYTRQFHVNLPSPGFDSRFGQSYFGFPWFPEITPRERSDDSSLKTGHYRFQFRPCFLSWPSRSPDLNPLDFWLWGHLMALVYATPISNVQALQQRVINAYQHILDQSGVFQRVHDSPRRRVQGCITMNGHHIEYLLYCNFPLVGLPGAGNLTVAFTTVRRTSRLSAQVSEKARGQQGSSGFTARPRELRQVASFPALDERN